MSMTHEFLSKNFRCSKPYFESELSKLYANPLGGQNYAFGLDKAVLIIMALILVGLFDIFYR